MPTSPEGTPAETPRSGASANPPDSETVITPVGAMYARGLGARLRAIRVQQDLSLQGVEEKSEGRWKGVVLGSYERGDRAISAQRLAELADFYQVPVTELLPQAAPNTALAQDEPRLVLHLDRLRAVPDERANLLERFTRAIQAQRGDYNGKVLTIRRDDLRNLAVLFDETAAALTARLTAWHVLDPHP